MPSMKNTPLALRREIEAMNTVMGNKRVRTVFHGGGACATNDTVFLPSMPDDAELTPRQMAVLRGFQIHEAEHVATTDMNLWNSKTCGARRRGFWNAAEDVLMERTAIGKYAGARRSLQVTIDEVLTSENEHFHKANLRAGPIDWDELVYAALQKSRKEMGYESEALDEYIRDLPPRLAKEADKWVDTLLECESTEETWAASGKIFRRANALAKKDEEKQRQQQQQQPTPGDDEGEQPNPQTQPGDGDGASDEDDSGQTQPGDEDEQQEGDDKGGSGPAPGGDDEDAAEGDDGSGGDEGGDDEQQEDGQGQPQPGGATPQQGHQPSGAGKSFLQDAEERAAKAISESVQEHVQPLISSRQMDWPVLTVSDFAEYVDAYVQRIADVNGVSVDEARRLARDSSGGDMFVRAMDRFRQPNYPETMAASITSLKRDMSADVRAYAGRLGRVLLAMEDKRKHPGQWEGLIDQKRLALLVAGQRNVFARLEKMDVGETAVCVSIDASDSMNRTQTRMAVLALNHALGLGEVPFEVVEWSGLSAHASCQGNGSSMWRRAPKGGSPEDGVEPCWLIVRKPYAMHWRKAERRFGDLGDPGGDTPTLVGVRASLMRLLSRPERRRALLVVTDGTPNWGDYEARATAGVVRTARNLGVEVYGIGVGDVGQSMMRIMFGQDAYVKVDFDQLGKTLLGQLERMVVKGERQTLSYQRAS